MSATDRRHHAPCDERRDRLRRSTRSARRPVCRNGGSRARGSGRAHSSDARRTGAARDHVLANRLDIAAGRITGTVQQPIVTGETKRQALLALAAELRIPLDQTMAVGDGANDLQMLAAAGVGVAFHAKPLVAARTRYRIDHADLTSLLYVQGYRKDEIVG